MHGAQTVSDGPAPTRLAARDGYARLKLPLLNPWNESDQTISGPVDVNHERAEGAARPRRRTLGRRRLRGRLQTGNEGVRDAPSN